MRAALLIGANLLREQRWPLLLLIALILGSALLVGRGESEDALAVLDLQKLYVFGFTVFLAAAAIHNERRSRRILAVLSKGISRSEYIAGMLLGAGAAVVVLCVAVGLAGAWMLVAPEVLRGNELGALLLRLGAGCLLMASITLFFSARLNPLFASLAAVVLVGTVQQLAAAMGVMSPLPLEALLLGNEEPAMGAVAVALGMTVVFTVAAAAVFGRRDIAVSVE